MPDGIYTALSGAIATEQAMDVIANNVANMSTTGFKGDKVSFREVQAQQLERRSMEDRQTAVDTIQPDMSAGPLHQTGNALDIAPMNDGFFVVQGAAGERYTRAGRLTVDSGGRLSTADGNFVLGQGGPIEVGFQGKAIIDQDGQVIRDGVVQDRIRMVRFDNPTALTREGASLFSAVATVPTEIDAAVHTGTIESSNVNAISGMTQLIQVSRAYESFNRAIELFHEVDSKTTSDLGR